MATLDPVAAYYLGLALQFGAGFLLGVVVARLIRYAVAAVVLLAAGSLLQYWSLNVDLKSLAEKGVSEIPRAISLAGSLLAAPNVVLIGILLGFAYGLLRK